MYSNFYDVNKLFLISEKKNANYVPNKDCANVIKFMKITSNSTHNKQERQKAQNDKKKSFLNETVENADLHKPVLNKTNTNDQKRQTNE